MTIRHDKNTGKYYTYHNIPLTSKKSKNGHLTSIQNDKGYYRIFESNHDRPDDSWYNGVKVCGDYAVFEWVNTSPSNGFYQQVSPWYIRYGYAVRKMIELSKS